jgi:H+/Cl- antiporter ClcA
MQQIRVYITQLRSVSEAQFQVIQKALNDQHHIEETKRRVLIAIPFWIAGIATALAATAYAKLFSLAENQAQLLYASAGYWVLLATPALFFLSFLVVEKIAPYANGSGIPQLMAAAEISSTTNADESEAKGFLDKLLGFRIILAKVLSSLLGVIGGGAIGREGPTLQIAGSIFHLTGKLFSRGQIAQAISKNHHGMILAGGAAGLAAAFNTPLGGIAYVVEELSRSHLSSFRTGVLHAVIMSGIFAQVAMGPYLYFGYPKIDPFQFANLGYVIAFAAFAGIVATLFGQILKSVVSYRATLKSFKNKATLAAVCGLIFAVVVVFGDHTAIGSGKELLTHLLFTQESSSILDVAYRFFGSLTTYAAGGAGGIFAPTLAIGGASASYLNSFIGGNLGPLSVLVGMTAALAALTHSPFTSFVLILEMTDRHSTIVPLMIAALIGQGLSKSISKHSFYEFVCGRILDAAPGKNEFHRENHQAELH